MLKNVISAWKIMVVIMAFLLVIRFVTGTPLFVSAETFNDQGYRYFLQGNYEQALVEFTNALNVDPRNARAFNDRCMTYNESWFGRL
jgi:hypothetical protein